MELAPARGARRWRPPPLRDALRLGWSIECRAGSGGRSRSCIVDGDIVIAYIRDSWSGSPLGEMHAATSGLAGIHIPGCYGIRHRFMSGSSLSARWQRGHGQHGRCEEHGEQRPCEAASSPRSSCQEGRADEAHDSLLERESVQDAHAPLHRYTPGRRTVDAAFAFSAQAGVRCLLTFPLGGPLVWKFASLALSRRASTAGS